MRMDELIKRLEEIGNRTMEVDKDDFYVSDNEASRMYDKGWTDGEIAMARKIAVWLKEIK
jgi:hypothetical protein